MGLRLCCASIEDRPYGAPQQIGPRGVLPHGILRRGDHGPTELRIPSRARNEIRVRKHAIREKKDSPGPINIRVIPRYRHAIHSPRYRIVAAHLRAEVGSP